MAPLIAPGFGPAETERLVELTRILLLAPIFLALSAVATSILNSAGRFAASVVAPIAYNLVVIAAAVLLVPPFGLAGLAWGTVAAAVATVLVQATPVFRQVGFHYTPRIDLRDAEARRTLVLLVPRAIGMAGSQLTLLLLTVLGSTLEPGAIGAFGLAFVIFQIPLGTIAYPLGIVALPALSNRVAAGEIDEYVALVTRALRLLGFAMIPIACIAAGVGLQVVDLVVDFGRVEASGVALTGAAFLGFLGALPSEAMIIVLSRAFFAARNTWIPVAAALVSVVVAVGTAALLIGPLGIFGLALGVTVASWVEAILLLGAFRYRHAGFGLLRLGRANLWYLAGGRGGRAGRGPCLRPRRRRPGRGAGPAPGPPLPGRRRGRRHGRLRRHRGAAAGARAGDHRAPRPGGPAPGCGVSEKRDPRSRSSGRTCVATPARAGTCAATRPRGTPSWRARSTGRTCSSTAGRGSRPPTAGRRGASSPVPRARGSGSRSCCGDRVRSRGRSPTVRAARSRRPGPPRRSRS